MRAIKLVIDGAGSLADRTWEESEVLEMMPCAGKDGGALPLGHYNFELEVTAGGGEVPGGLGSRFRLVR